MKSQEILNLGIHRTRREYESPSNLSTAITLISFFLFFCTFLTILDWTKTTNNGHGQEAIEESQKLITIYSTIAIIISSSKRRYIDREREG